MYEYVDSLAKLRETIAAYDDVPDDPQWVEAWKRYTEELKKQREARRGK